MTTAAACAVHPGRPAVDACPVCARPRCGPDADAAPGGGCAACRGAPARLTRPASRLELLVRGALAGYAVALLMALVVSEYVEAGLFAYVVPFLLGVLTGEAVQRAAGTTRPDRGLRAVAAGIAVLGVAAGLAVEGSAGLTSVQAVPGYAAGVLGALLWTVPPKRRVRAAADG